MQCPICNNTGRYIFSNMILKKYDVKYFQCEKCAFVYTEKPYWLDEAYSRALVDSDTGVMVRNIENVVKVRALIKNFYKGADRTFLDYGGGYGIFTRMMRDVGYNFLWSDKYAAPMVSRGFEYTGKDRIDLVTNFEVFEHFENPVEELRKCFEVSKELIFSTLCYDKKYKWKKQEWWYYNPDEGQHIAFYSEVTLEFLAKMFGLNYYNVMDLHWFTQKKVSKFRLKIMRLKYKLGLYRMEWVRKLNYQWSTEDHRYLRKR